MHNLKFETLSLESPAAHVTQVTLNRPEVLNALNTQMMLDLRDLFTQFYVDQGTCRMLILTGAGTRAFCSGGDLKQRNGMSDEVWRQQHAVLEQMIRAAMDCPVPLMAAVNGSCFGGGLELALVCDFIYAAATARFGFPEGRIGIMPGAAGTQNLVRACGVRRAKEITLSGEPFTAAEGEQWGLVNKVVEPDLLLQQALEIAASIVKTAPVSARQIKKSLNIASNTDFATGYAFEIEAYNRTVPMKDRLEGIKAFNEKRPPVFTGE